MKSLFKINFKSDVEIERSLLQFMIKPIFQNFLKEDTNFLEFKRMLLDDLRHYDSFQQISIMIKNHPYSDPKDDTLDNYHIDIYLISKPKWWYNLYPNTKPTHPDTAWDHQKLNAGFGARFLTKKLDSLAFKWSHVHGNHKMVAHWKFPLLLNQKYDVTFGLSHGRSEGNSVEQKSDPFGYRKSCILRNFRSLVDPLVRFAGIHRNLYGSQDDSPSSVSMWSLRDLALSAKLSDKKFVGRNLKSN